MKALVNRRYGPPSVLALEDVGAPIPGAQDVVVRVHAAAINPGDWDVLHGQPYVLRLGTGLRRPRNTILGIAIAGRVSAVGSTVSEWRPGDEVYGEIGKGGFAECVAAPAAALAPKPTHLTFEQAAAVPVSGVTALQALRDVGRVQRGATVLINGASGGVGTFAVQIAKAFGAVVTGVCSGTNVDLVRSLGADHVIDYGLEDFTRTGQRFDLILDNAGNRTLSDLRRALAPGGTLIPNSNKGGDRWLGRFLRRAGQALLLSPLVRQRLRPFAATASRTDLLALNELMASGAVSPVIDRSYRLEEVAEALRYVGLGHARGKVVISMFGGEMQAGGMDR